MIGGYSVVAEAMNAHLIWPDRRTVTRQQVAAWVSRGTPNKFQQGPPSAVEEDRKAGRTEPKLLWDTDHWVSWALGGVPADRGHGWVVPERRVPPLPMTRPQRQPLLVRPRKLNDKGMWVLAHPDRKPVELER